MQGGWAVREDVNHLGVSRPRLILVKQAYEVAVDEAMDIRSPE